MRLRSCFTRFLVCLCIFGSPVPVLADEAFTEQDIRFEITDLKKQKRLKFVEMIKITKEECLASKSLDDPEFRTCFHSEIKNKVKDHLLRDREAKRNCRITETTALSVQLCALKIMSGEYLESSQTSAKLFDTAVFHKTVCPFETNDPTIVCGKVTVPLNRQTKNGLSIDLAVAVLQSTGTGKTVEPMFFLEGGPGGQSLSSAEIWVDSVYRKNRDIVLFDQRGTGFSEPKLACPEYDAAYLRSISSGEEIGMMQAEADALRSCFQKYETQGVDFSAFTSIEGARDIEAIRQALGYKKIDLLGISYGSRLALTAMRDYPESIKSVVLESVLPLQENMFLDSSTVIEDIFMKIFEKCDADAACAITFPHFVEDFDELFFELEKAPVDVAYVDAEAGETVEIAMGVPQLATAVYRLIATSEGIAYLPMLVDIAKSGDFELFSRIFLEIEAEIADQIDTLVNFATLCNEEYAPLEKSPQKKSSLSFLAEPEEEFLSTYDLICSDWKYPKASALENSPVVSDIPTLILSGEFDPITPASWAKKAKQDLKRAVQLVFPVGHGELTAFPGCGADIADNFFKNPLKKPDIACMDNLSDFRFITE